MADATTISGLPFPEGSDANNVPSDMAGLANALDGTIVKKLTSVEIAALAGGEKPAGTLVYNTTTGKVQKSNGSTFVNVVDVTGDTFTGNLAISKAGPVLSLAAASGGTIISMTRASGETAGVQFNEPDGSARWMIYHDTDDTLRIGRYNAAGVSQGAALSIDTATGNITVAGKIAGLATGTASGEAVHKGQVTSGTKTGTTGSNGEVTLTLPESPTGNWAVTVTGTAVDGSGGTGYGPMFYVTATSSTSATVRAARSSTGAYINNTSVTFLYTAVAY